MKERVRVTYEGGGPVSSSARGQYVSKPTRKRKNLTIGM